MRSQLKLIIILLIANIFQIASAALPRIVQIETGFIRGQKAKSEVGAFLGIPYAAPPIGELRWQPPTSVSAWSGIRSAERFSAACLQPSPEPKLQSEDCLYLNIWTPAKSTYDRLPVMLWIHGGGFTYGSGADPNDNGSILARQGVIVVTINYRLGLFGFLGHKLLSAESIKNVSGNYGFFDQIAALQWVQRNINQFGGDAKNVTVFGESAGGSSVAALMASPSAQGLFHKAIAQSGYDSSLRPLRRAESSDPVPLEEIGEEAAKILGCDQKSDVLSCLRAMPSQTVFEKIYADGVNFPQLSPVVDGFVLPESPHSVFMNGRQAKVPTIVGVMRNEQIRDPSLRKLTTIEAYRGLLSSCFPKNAGEVFEQFPVKGSSEIFVQAERLLTHLFATGPARRMAASMTQLSVPTFWFQFTRIPPFAQRQGWGAFHSLDVSYVFQSDMVKPNFEDLDFSISLQVQKMWASFARTGSPTANRVWPIFDEVQQAYMEIGDEFLTKYGLEREALDLLDSVEKGNCAFP